METPDDRDKWCLAENSDKEGKGGRKEVSKEQGATGWSERACFVLLVFLVVFPNSEILSLQFKNIFQKLFKVILVYLNYFFLSIWIS